MNTQLTLKKCTDANNGTGVEINIPLSELGNAIAIFGWTITNDLNLVGDVRDEYNRLSDLEYLDILDGQAFTDWRDKYVRKIQF